MLKLLKDRQSAIVFTAGRKGLSAAS